MELEQNSISAALPRHSARLMRLASFASVGVACTLMLLKGWAWLVTDSVALLGSLVDSFLDLIASLITLLAIRVAISPADKEHRFGHGKSEGIASLVQALIVTASAVYVGGKAVVRLAAPSAITQPSVGIAVMLVSLVLTISLVGFQRHVVRRTDSLAVSADSLHYRADILTNLGVLAAIFFSSRFGLYIVDPVLGLLIAGVILYSVRSIFREALDILLDRELPSSERKRIREIACGHPAVLGLHDLRTRSAGSAQFIQFHLELDPALTLTEAHDISDEVELDVQRNFPRAEILIHADPYGLPESRDPF
jgi:ferrous-iron efflux pump FieF